MLVPLRAERRRTLLRSAWIACAAALALAPFSMPYAFEAEADSGLATVPQPAAQPEPQDQARLPGIARDPFVPEASAMVPAVGGGAPEGSAAFAAAAPVVEAVALGDAPQALVESGGSSRIVRVGDSLYGSTVAGIDRDGIVLQDGETLPYAGAK